MTGATMTMYSCHWRDIFRPEIGVSHDKVAEVKGVEHRAKQALFVGAFTTKAAHGGIQYGATGQTNNADDAANGKPSPGF